MWSVLPYTRFAYFEYAEQVEFVDGDAEFDTKAEPGDLLSAFCDKLSAINLIFRVEIILRWKTCLYLMNMQASAVGT